MISILGGFGAGLVLGLFYHVNSVWFLLVIPMAALIAVSFYWVVRRVDRSLDKFARERIKHLRGAQGEALVAWHLQDLGDDWHVFNGIMIEDHRDIDHVVVGPGGFFCISTKSNRGLFTRAEDGLLHNNKACEFERQAMRDAMDLKDRLGGLMGANLPWIQPVLAVPFGWIEGDERGGSVWIVHTDNMLRHLDPDDAPAKLNAEQIAQTVQALTMLKSSGAAVYRRGLVALAPHASV